MKLINFFLRTLLITFPFALFYFLLFIIHLFHFFRVKFLLKKNILINWIEFFIVLLRKIIFLLLISIRAIFIVTQYKVRPRDCNNFCIFINVYFTTLLFGPTLILIFNCLQKIIIIFEIIILLNKNKIIHISKTTPTFLEIIILFTSEIILLFLFIFIYKNINNKKLYEHVKLILRIITLSILFMQLIILLLLKIYKKKLLESSNITNRNWNTLIKTQFIKYNISFYSDFLIYKSIGDMLINIPSICFIGLNYYPHSLIIFNNILFIIYIYYIGTLYVWIDKEEGIETNYLYKKLFCIKKINLLLGDLEFKQCVMNYANLNNKNKVNFNSINLEYLDTYEQQRSNSSDKNINTFNKIELFDLNELDRTSYNFEATNNL